jgi:anti-sigma factor RsiW
MAMTHEQIDEQMVDFLYGELPADARAAFEAHVAGCDRCRREVESFGQVRTVARTVLDEAPPARVHDAILRAAREAAAAAPAKEALKEAQKEAKKERKKAEPARASLWDWLRGKWAFPTLATVGALTVFILGSRLFLNPNTVHQLGRPAPVSEPAASTPGPERPMDSTGAVRAVEKVSPAPPATAPAPSEASAEAPARAAHVRRQIASEAKAARKDGAHPAASAPFGHRAAGRPGAASLKSDPLEGSLGSGAGAREKSSKQDDLLEGLSGPARDKAPAAGGGGYAEPPPPAAAEKPQANADFGARRGVQKKSKRAVEDIEDDRLQAKEEAAPAEPSGGKGRVYAQPPPPAAAPAPAPRYAEPAPSKAAAEPESYAGDDTAELAKSLPRPAAKPQSRASRSSGAAPAPPAPAPVAASRARSRAEEAESVSLADEQPVRETLVQRADRLFTQGRWAEAAVAYRDLLRQQPNSPEAERWRRRLAAARAAVATGRPPPPSSR